MKTQTKAVAKNKHRMVVIDGIPGITRQVVYSYRGHKIIRRMRTYDVRNKTHNGYDWTIEGYAVGIWSQSNAKARVDLIVALVNNSPTE